MLKYLLIPEETIGQGGKKCLGFSRRVGAQEWRKKWNNLKSKALTFSNMREWFHSRFSFPFIDRFILAFLKQLKIKKDFIMLCNKHVISHILSHLILLVMLQLAVRTVSIGHPTASRAQPNVKHLEGSQIYLVDEWLPKMSFFFFPTPLYGWIPALITLPPTAFPDSSLPSLQRSLQWLMASLP